MQYYNVYTSDYENALKSNMYKLFLKIELLDHFEKTIKEISQELSIESSNGSISVNYQQGVRRTCSLTFRNLDNQLLPNHNSFIWINQKFKIYLGVKSAEHIYWWSQGVFIVKEYSINKYQLNIDGVDKFGFFTSDLNQHCLQGTYKIPYDTNYKAVITSTISMDMGNGIPIDPIDPIIDISMVNNVLPYDISKDTNNYLGDVLIELATSLNADIYYDIHGQLIMTASKSDVYPLEAPSWFFDTNNSDIFNLSIKYDLGNVINVCKVYGTDVDGLIHTYTAKNNNPSSPTRISLIGEKFDKSEESDMCYDDKHCHDYAWYKLNQSSVVSMSATFSCPILPHLDVNKIVSITNKSNNWYQEHCVITSLTIPLSLNEMSISVCNIKYLPCYEESQAYS